jgi:hypothetical protein
MSLRFIAIYVRCQHDDWSRFETVKRVVHGVSAAVVAAKVEHLPRFVELVSLEQRPETPAEAAARLQREHNAPVPYGC